MRDLDTRGFLKGVTTFNFHMHLPHYEVTTEDTKSIHVMARQPIDLSNPHPFTEAGNREFNMFLWMPPSGDRAGDVLLADSTIFSTLFGVSESLENFWRNLGQHENQLNHCKRQTRRALGDTDGTIGYTC